MQPLDRATLRVEEVCTILDLSESLVRKLIKRGELPVIRAGKRVLVSRAALDRWLENSGQPAGVAGPDAGGRGHVR